MEGSRLPDEHDLGPVPGLLWNPEGMVGFTGDLVRLFEAVDGALGAMGTRFEAAAAHFAPLVAAADMRKMALASSFPHLVTLPIALDTDPRDLEAFRGFADDMGTGPWVVGKTAPVKTALLPGACYALYPSLQGADLGSKPLNVTFCTTCFRQQTHYQPLRRQWAFRMREIVHVGSAESTERFLGEARDAVRLLAASLGLGLDCVPAGDPFFDLGDARKVAASNAPTKDELIFDRRLALGSLNRHHDAFGQVFSIRFGGAPAHSACVALGLERWMYAILATHGLGPAEWPLL